MSLQSPHTQGSNQALRPPRLRLPTVPAYAGVKPAVTPCCSAAPYSPRIRGGQTAIPRRYPHDASQSPHTRGSNQGWPLPLSGKRTVPAYAGVKPPSRTARSSSTHSPRIRGGQTWKRGPLIAMTEQSPHTQGSNPAIATPSPSADSPRIRGGQTPDSQEDGRWTRTVLAYAGSNRSKRCERRMPVRVHMQVGRWGDKRRITHGRA